MGLLKPSALKPGSTFALDTVVFVYFLELHPTYYTTVKKIFCRIETGKLKAVMSSLVFAELLVPAYKANDRSRAQTLIRVLTNFPNLQVIPLSPEISAEAARLRAIFNIRTPDAIHAATALEAKADGIITNDKGFLRLSNELDILMLDKDQQISN